jgi:hypothetical protein
MFLPSFLPLLAGEFRPSLALPELRGCLSDGGMSLVTLAVSNNIQGILSSFLSTHPTAQNSKTKGRLMNSKGRTKLCSAPKDFYELFFLVDSFLYVSRCRAAASTIFSTTFAWINVPFSTTVRSVGWRATRSIMAEPPANEIGLLLKSR